MGDSVAQKNRAGQVVTRRARSLLGAADSRRHKSEPEDRLTEILREVLMTAPALASWLVEKAFELSPEDAKRCCAYGIRGQYTCPRGGGRPDVQIRFAGEHRPPGQLFCENKIRAGRFIVLSRLGVLPPGLPENERRKFVPLRWNDLAREADRVGRLWGGIDWRAEAVSPSAPGQHRMLAAGGSPRITLEDRRLRKPRPRYGRDFCDFEGV